VGATVLAPDRSRDAVCVLFEFSDSRTQSLANVLLRWMPSFEELQAIERATNVLRRGVRVHWPADLTKHGLPQNTRRSRKVIGQVLRAGDT
jgi:hypothetical protein